MKERNSCQALSLEALNTSKIRTLPQLRHATCNRVKQICPPVQMFLQNHYQQATVSDASQLDTFYSEEGCTQGDPAAMAFYSLGAKPLMDELDACINKEFCKQCWFADDSSAVGRLK